MLFFFLLVGDVFDCFLLLRGVPPDFFLEVEDEPTAAVGLMMQSRIPSGNRFF